MVSVTLTPSLAQRQEHSFENTGNASEPHFTAPPDIARFPFSSNETRILLQFSFADMDDDVDLDAAVGKVNGDILFFGESARRFRFKFRRSHLQRQSFQLN